MDLNPANWGLFLILTKYCHLYLDDVKLDNVKMALWAGHANIRDFSLKTDLMKCDQLPLRVVEAHIDQVDITIPWKAWKSRGPEISISGMRIVLETTLNSSHSSSSPSQLKEDALARFDSQVSDLISWVESVLKGNGSLSFLTKSMASALLNNLKITLLNLVVELRHIPGKNEDVSEFVLRTKVERIASFSTDSEFREKMGWDQVFRFRKVEAEGVRITSKKKLKPESSSETPVILKTSVMTRTSLTAGMSMKHYDFIEFTTAPSDIQITLTISPIHLRVSRRLINLMWDIALALNRWELYGNGQASSWKEMAQRRWKYAREKVMESVRSQLMRRSIAYISRKLFWKEMYIKGYILRLKKALIPQNQIGFSHGEKVKDKLSDPRFLSAVFYDLETLLSIEQIQNYRREAVERHLLKETGLSDRQIEYGKAQKTIIYSLNLRLESISLELFGVYKYSLRNEQHLQDKLKVREESLLLFEAEDVRVVHESDTKYSPLFTIHNRFSHISTATRIDLSSLNLWLTKQTPNFDAIKKPIFRAPARLRMKLAFRHRETESISIKFTENDFYVYPEMLSAFQSFFSFCGSSQPGKYDREAAFFAACRASSLFQKRSAIDFNLRLAFIKSRIVVMSEYANGANAAILELMSVNIKGEKWPSDTVTTNIKAIRGFAMKLEKANSNISELLAKAQRVFFTAYFSTKVFISTFRTLSVAVKDREARLAAMYKELRTPEYLVSVIAKELLFDLTGDQLKSLVALGAVWKGDDLSDGGGQAYTPMDLDLTTKVLRRAAKQVKFSLELDCKGAVFNVVSNSGPYMKIIAHQFEASYKGKLFDRILLFQCQGVEILDTRVRSNAVLFAIQEGRASMDLIHKAQLDENGFRVDRKHALLVSTRSVAPESEDYRNIGMELQLAAASLHVTYNPNIISATLKVFEPLWKSDNKRTPGFTEQSEAVFFKDMALRVGECEILKAKVVLDWGELVLNCVYEEKELFTLYVKNVVSVLDVFPFKMQVRLDSEDVHCVDTSKGPAFNRLVMCKAEEISHFALNYKSTSFPGQNDSSLLQVRLKKSRLVYLHRVVMDVMSYMQQFLVGESDPNAPPSSPMAIEILFSECEIDLPRNSLSRESQCISIEKLTIRRNVSEVTTFETLGLFEYEENDPSSSRCAQHESKQAARLRRERLKQSKWTANSKSGLAEPAKLRDLHLTYEEIKQLPDLILKNLSVYYYKPETHSLMDGMRDQTEIRVVMTERSPSHDLSQRESSERESLSDRSIDDSGDEVVIDMGRSDDVEIFTPAPDPAEAFERSATSLEDLIQKDLSTPLHNVDSSKLFTDKTPCVSASNWRIVATNVCIEDLNRVELMKCRLLMVFMFSSSEAGAEVSKLQIQLEDDMNFYFPQRSYTFLLQTFLENMGELTSIPPVSPPILDLPDSISYQIVLISKKASFMFSTDPDPDEVNEGQTEPELAQLTWDSLRLTCCMMASGEKKIEIEMDNIFLRDQRMNSLLGILAESPNFEAYFLYPIISDNGVQRINLTLEMNMYPTGEKDIRMALCNSRILIAPDLLSKVQGFFTAIFDPKINPPPAYVRLPAVIPRAPMTFELTLESINFLLPSSYESVKSTVLVIHTEFTKLTYIVIGDAYNGPGSVKSECKLKISNMFFSNFEQQQLDQPDPANILMMADLNIEYVMQKPVTSSSWIGEQIFIHFVDREQDLGREKEEEKLESNWHFSVTISEIMKIIDISNCLTSASLLIPPVLPSSLHHSVDLNSSSLPDESLQIQNIGQLPRKTSPDIPQTAIVPPGEELRNISINLAIDKVLVTILNKDIHPLLSLLLASVGCYQAQGLASSQCQLVINFTVHYFNQRTTAWEPAVESSSWDLDLLTHNHSTKVTLSSDINSTLLPTNINISYALIDLLGGLWKNWNQEIEGTELSSATPYLFINHTGLPLWISTTSDDSTEPFNIEPEGTGKVSRRFAGQGKSLRFGSIGRYKIDIVVNQKRGNTKGHFPSSEEFSKVKNVPIDTSDIHIMPLTEKFAHTDLSAYKRSASKRVKTLKLKDKIESFFIKPEQDQELTEDSTEQQGSKCCACLPCFHKDREEEVENQEQSNLRLLVVEVRWVQEQGYKEILIRSSLTLINTLPTSILVEMTTLSSAGFTSEVIPGKKLYIPLPVVNYGTIRVRPNMYYDWSRPITLSALCGVVNEKELKRVLVEGRFHGTEAISLSFIPLLCNNSKNASSVPFSCALDIVKKKNNTIRRKVSKDERYRWVPDKRMPNMRAKSKPSGKQTHNDTQDEESDLEDLGEEELIFQERELLISSIMSITNALPEICKVELSGDGDYHDKKITEKTGNDKESEFESIAQGQTCHFFFRKFYEKSSKIRIKLAGYNWSNVLKINFPKIKEEKKFLAKLLGRTTNHKLFVWLSVSNDDFSCWRMTIFAPFWILNKTQFELVYAEPDLFQQKREAKLQKDSEKVLKESAAPDLFIQSGDDDPEDDPKATTKLYSWREDKRKSRRVDRHLTCPHCGCFTDSGPGMSEYLCRGCGKNFAAEEGKGKPKERDEKEIECPACHYVFTIAWSQTSRKDLKCIHCDAFIYKPKHVTLLTGSEIHDETSIKRAPISAPGVISNFSSKKTASVFSANKQNEWAKFVIYSTSQMVTKLKVAMMDSEIKNGKNVISKWSDTFSLGNAGTSGKLSFNMHTDMKVDLGVRIDRGKGIFHRTNIITFTPRYLLKCHNSLKLVCRQVGTEHNNFSIKPDELTTFNWPDRHLPEEMSVALFNEYSSNLKWSGAFHIHEQGEFVIFVQNEARKSEDFILVSISAVGPTFVVQFQPQKKDDAPPYILRNYTKHQITYFQALNGKSEKIRTLTECKIEGGKTIPFSHYYTLDEETQKPIVEVVIENEHKLYYLDQLGEQEPLDLQSNLPSGLEPKHRKAGYLSQKRQVIHTYKQVFMEVSDGWMYRKKNEHVKERKRISLLEECVKAAIYKGSAFYFYTCLKKYKFKTGSENEANEWVKVIMEAKDASETLNWQLIHVDIALDGATHIVSFRSGNAREQKSRHLPACKVLMEQMETRKKMKSKEIDYEFQFAVSSINISIIDGTPQETLLLSLSGVQVAYYHYINNYEGFQMTVDILKLDNQMMQNMWPVICAPFARKEKDVKKSVFISFSKKSVPQLDHIHYLNIYLQPIELRLEGAVLNLLLHAYDKVNTTFFGGETAKTKHRDKQEENQVFKYSYADSFEEVLDMAESPVIPPHELIIPYSQKKLFIEELIIQPFCIVLSVNMNSPIDSPLPRMFLISLASIGLAITSIEAAEINMEGLKMYDMYQLRSRFAERLIQHYYSTCVFQVYKLLGAMEFLGNPANLLQTFKAGMKDAFVDPVYTLMRNPTEFIPELLKGGFGMVTNTIHGVISSASKLAGGIGRSLALLTMDQQFQRARRNLLNRKVSSIGDGLMVGLKQLSYGLIDGVTSIVTSPMQGYRQKGVEGLFAGIGKGIVGTVVKPVSGLFDAFSATTSSLGKYARAKFKVRYLDRNRIPRHFHKDRILYPYDAALAQAQFLLYRFNPVYRHEIVIFFSELVKKKEKYVLIITKTHIFYMKDKPSASEKGKKFNRETIQDIKTQDYAKSLHIVFKDGKKLIIDCNWLEGEKDKVKGGDFLQDTKWKELTEICRKFGRDARMRNSEDDPSNHVV